MNLVNLLETSRATIIQDAVVRLTRAHLPHYSASEIDENERRLGKLYDLTLTCVKSRKLAPIVDYAGEVARERFHAGFDLGEVHTAFNVLEETIWHTITAQLEPARYPEAFGLASTVLGAGKQALAVEYVALASADRGLPSLDLTALFQGGAR
jgi:hypothetical protein